MVSATNLKVYPQGKTKYVWFTFNLENKMKEMKDNMKESVPFVMLMTVLHIYIWLKWQKGTSIW